MLAHPAHLLAWSPGHVALVAAALLAAALIGARALEEDPRYVGVDWALTRDKLRLYVLSRVKGSRIDAEDIVQTALRKVLEPDARPWDRETYSILSYLVGFAKTALWNARKTFFYKRCRFELTQEMLEQHAGQATDPVSMLQRAAYEARGERMLGELKRRLEGYPLPQLLIGIYEEGTPSPDESTERALAAGYTNDELTAARQRFTVRS